MPLQKDDEYNSDRCANPQSAQNACHRREPCKAVYDDVVYESDYDYDVILRWS